MTGVRGKGWIAIESRIKTPDENRKNEAHAQGISARRGGVQSRESQKGRKSEKSAFRSGWKGHPPLEGGE